ncbi:Huntingtin [Schistosoma japonicum]|uniref:Huntingtin n=1 Tax=Schistosoma japonicum TaxID=6182 RepID=A0A4Z2CKP8_SCHJA|nr:Huntingtin [Schistosoma japonicum]
MSSIPVTELDLLSALQAVGALNKSDETSRLFESKSTLNDAPIGTASSIWSDSFPIFERSESLRIIHNLVEGLIRVQTRDSSTATRHLGVVLSSLFRFLSDSNSDVRIAADEGLNKLIKVNCLLSNIEILSFTLTVNKLNRLQGIFEGTSKPTLQLVVLLLMDE